MKNYEWNVSVYGQQYTYVHCTVEGKWCTFMFDCLVAFYACKTYLHASSPDNHTLWTSMRIVWRCANEHTHINYLDALKWISFCSNIAQPNLAHKFLELLNKCICSLDAIDETLFYFEQKLSMMIFLFIWNEKLPLFMMYMSSGSRILNKWQNAVWQGRFDNLQLG